MNKLMIVMLVAAGAASVWAGPCGGGRGCGGGGGCRPCRPAYRPCRPCGGGDWWGKGGRNFWPGFIGGVVGGIVGNAVARPYYSDTVVVQPTTTVVTQPVVVQQPVVQTVVSQSAQVWVEGRYVDQVQANGAVVRVWQTGHYE